MKKHPDKPGYKLIGESSDGRPVYVRTTAAAPAAKKAKPDKSGKKAKK